MKVLREMRFASIEPAVAADVVAMPVGMPMGGVKSRGKLSDGTIFEGLFRHMECQCLALTTVGGRKRIKVE